MIATGTDMTERETWAQVWKEVTDDQAAFIADSSLVFLLSHGADEGPDVSPRGDAGGFVMLVGRTRLRLPDRIGNNRLDTMQNLLKDPRITVLFTRKGDDRVLSIAGIAEIRTELELLQAFAVRERPPRSVMDVGILSATFIAAPALAASGFWTVDAGDAVAGVASLGEILADQVGGMTKEEGEAFIANSYANKLY